MNIDFKYLHTNLTVRNIEKMKEFYVSVFGFSPVREIHMIEGEWIEKITKVGEGKIKYVHLKFPGFQSPGPELELIQYLNPTKQYDITPNTYGFGHLAFSVSDVKEALDLVTSAGGGSIGEIVTVEVPNRGLLTEVYATDPEGNIIELQSYA